MRNILIAISCSITFSAWSQVGGQKSFEFLNVPAYARLAALGGVNVSLADQDVNFFASNPGLTSDTLSGFGAVNYQFYVADIGQAFFSYAHRFRKIGLVSMGIQHIGYGTIQGYDHSGVETGTFRSGETALLISKSHTIRNITLGSTIKTLFSNIAGYRAGAVAVDLGGVFKHPGKNLTVGVLIKNLGFTLSEYSETSNSHVPFDVQLGATFAPQHMPVRFSITAFNLAKADVTYYDPNSEDEKPGAVQKIFSHLTFGGEVLIHKNVTILVGYNYLNHQALKLTNGGGGAGLSFGFSAHIKSFDFVFSRSGYVAGNAGYSFTLSTSIQKLIKRQ